MSQKKLPTSMVLPTYDRMPESIEVREIQVKIEDNLIRRVMLQTAAEAGQSPRELSFTAALQNIAASWMPVSVQPSLTAAAAAQCRTNLSKCVIGDRPGRIEPRAVKRRPKPHALLTKPRAEAKAELIRQTSPQLLTR